MEVKKSFTLLQFHSWWKRKMKPLSLQYCSQATMMAIVSLEIQLTTTFASPPTEEVLYPGRCQPQGRFQLKFRYQCQWMTDEGIQPVFEFSQWYSFPPPPIFFDIITDIVFSAFIHFNCAWFIPLFHQIHLSEKNESYEKESEGCQILNFY